MTCSSVQARYTNTAEEQRLWLEVGVAVMHGKIKANRKAGQKFSEWVVEMFLGICTKHEVSAAIWLASEFPGNWEKLPHWLSYSKNIKAWLNEQRTTPELPEDLQAVEPEPTITLPQREE